MSTDILHRFLLETPNVRGAWTSLEQTWQQLSTKSNYPPAIKTLLGEALAAITLLSTTIKHNGSIILQLRGNGPVHLVVVQIQANGSVRGLARWSAIPEDTRSLNAMMGQGHIAITLEAEKESERYQGIIALEGDSLAQALENYFQQSEQLPTRLYLSANDQRCAGILVQRIPESQPDPENFERVSLLLDTLTPEELLDLAAAPMLYRLFHEENVRLFNASPVFFQCTCSVDRIERMLITLGNEEVEAILAEQGKIDITCEFCNTLYSLDSIDAKHLFLKGVAPINNTLH
ncbi:Hsp33 family molecular chaperone HslO [Thiofilum flexile]|uniref:Hsp33 family molecular chaperone HslO n=1 Tax=Thiofilum flexile TaxID=125627 RepID=UPI0003621FDE|nr:Hsp33 family molecular chaperone HslO [Thiofilum flexile]